METKMTPFTELSAKSWGDPARLPALVRATVRLELMKAGLVPADEYEALRKDAERYRWLASRNGLALRTEYPMMMTRPDGTTYIARYSIAEGGTQHQLAETLDAAIDAAMNA